MPQHPPREPDQKDRYCPRQTASASDHDRIGNNVDRPGQRPPLRRGRYERQRKERQPDPVAALLWVDLSGTGADPTGEATK
jgi:hypothetical protein